MMVEYMVNEMLEGKELWRGYSNREEKSTRRQLAATHVQRCSGPPVRNRV